MYFTTFEFWFFTATLFIIYWSIGRRFLKLQNLVLLIGSYFFYFQVDWKFSVYLFITSLINFYIGKLIESKPSIKRPLVIVSIIQCLGGLVILKYYDFFITSFSDFAYTLGLSIHVPLLRVIAPIGISFFSFKALDYVFDINRGKMIPTNNVVTFLNYISFFPTLLSGPIDKANHFIPQLIKARSISYEAIKASSLIILWGLFKKLVIADNCNVLTSYIFTNYQEESGLTLLYGAVIYTFQIYTDFSGYSDIAIGVGGLLGFKVSKNFDFPLFAQNIADFWRKWHITLTKWLTENVFTPINIALRDWGKSGLMISIIVNFIAIGAWHGPKWNYVIFGLLHGLFYFPLIMRGKLNKRVKIKKDQSLPTFKQAINMLATFILVTFAFVFFRFDTPPQALEYVSNIYVNFSFELIVGPHKKLFLIASVMLIIMLLIEWWGRNDDFAIQTLFASKPKLIRWSFYALIVFMIGMYAKTGNSVFIYFQF